jgi:hypothetical protein
MVGINNNYNKVADSGFCNNSAKAVVAVILGIGWRRPCDGGRMIPVDKLGQSDY